METVTLVKLIKSKNLLLIILALFFLYLIIFRYNYAADVIIVILIFFSLLITKKFEFARDWLPFLLLFMAFVFARGHSDEWNRQLLGSNSFFSTLDTPLNYAIYLEKKVIFFFPETFPVYIQNHLSFNTLLEKLFIIVLYFLYMSFFWFWLIAGTIIWLKKRDKFKRFYIGLIGLSFFSCLFYFLFPSVPPWYASEIGIIDPLRRLFWEYHFLPANTVWDYLEIVKYGDNLFAAFPSLHAGWPMYAVFGLTIALEEKLPLRT